jgi:hypothetical protein
MVDPFVITVSFAVSEPEIYCPNINFLSTACVSPGGFEIKWDTMNMLNGRGIISVPLKCAVHMNDDMLAKEINVKVISERLGYSNIKVTLDTHSHVLPTMQDEAAKAIEDLYGTKSIKTKNHSSLHLAENGGF